MGEKNAYVLILIGEIPPFPSTKKNKPTNQSIPFYNILTFKRDALTQLTHPF